MERWLQRAIRAGWSQRSVTGQGTREDKPVGLAASALQIALDDCAGAGAGIRPEFAARIDRGVDTGMNVVADDGTEFAPTGIQ